MSQRIFAPLLVLVLLRTGVRLRCVSLRRRARRRGRLSLTERREKERREPEEPVVARIEGALRRLAGHSGPMAVPQPGPDGCTRWGEQAGSRSGWL